MTKASRVSVEMPATIEHWPVSKLAPYDRNPRTHSPEQITRLAASITEFGFTNPILVDEAGVLIAGHGRLEAAKQLGLAEVPVIQLPHLTPAQKRAYVIADNKLAMDAGWDDRILQEELEALNLEGFDLDLTGFGTTEMSILMGGTDFIGGEDLQKVPRDNNNMNMIRGNENPDSEKAMAGFWFRDIQVSVPMGLYERFAELVQDPRWGDRREAVVSIIEKGLNHC